MAGADDVGPWSAGEEPGREQPRRIGRFRGSWWRQDHQAQDLTLGYCLQLGADQAVMRSRNEALRRESLDGEGEEVVTAAAMPLLQFELVKLAAGIDRRRWRG